MFWNRHETNINTLPRPHPMSRYGKEGSSFHFCCWMKLLAHQAVTTSSMLNRWPPSRWNIFQWPHKLHKAYNDRIHSLDHTSPLFGERRGSSCGPAAFGPGITLFSGHLHFALNYQENTYVLPWRGLAEGKASSSLQKWSFRFHDTHYTRAFASWLF